MKGRPLLKAVERCQPRASWLVLGNGNGEWKEPLIPGRAGEETELQLYQVVIWKKWHGQKESDVGKSMKRAFLHSGITTVPSAELLLITMATRIQAILAWGRSFCAVCYFWLWATSREFGVGCILWSIHLQYCQCMGGKHRFSSTRPGSRLGLCNKRQINKRKAYTFIERKFYVTRELL